jgi:spermidine synthase
VFTRQTRNGIELRIDGTLASVYRPGQVTTGPVWDALAAPLLALPPRRRRRILMLGFAGGSVARVARALAPQATIVGVDRDGEVLGVARRELGIDELGVELIVDDAVAYLERERRTFDVVVEDVIVGSVRHVRRPRHLLERYELVRRRVAPGGVLVTNTIHDTAAVARLMAKRPGTLVSIGIKEHYNHVLAVGPTTLRASAFRHILRTHPILSASLPGFNLRTLRA